LTQHEYDQLSDLLLALAKIGEKLSDICVRAGLELAKEDAHHTALEQQQPGAHDGKQRSV